MKKINLTLILVLSLFCIASQALGQGARTNRELRKLITEFHDAERVLNSEKMKVLLDDDFKGTTSSGYGTATFSKSQIVGEDLGDKVEILRKVLSNVVTSNKISPLLIKGGRNTAQLKYSLTLRMQLKAPDTAETFKYLERFEIKGTAIRKNGKWQLKTLDKKVPTHKIADDEITENLNFGIMLVALVLEEEKRRGTNP